MNTSEKLTRIGAALLAAGLLYWLLAPRGEKEPAKPAPEPNYFSFVHSMEGTHPDGDLKVGPGDQLVVDAELGHLFDYYLAGLGEKDLAAIRAGIEQELDRRLQPKAAAQAKRLLTQYLAYKRALVNLEQRLPSTGDLAQAAHARMNAMQQLRLEYFSASESAGLFGASDAYDLDALQRVEISLDKTLSAEQKQQKLAALDAKLPPAMVAERDAPKLVMKMEEQVQQMRAGGASDDDVYRMRAATISPEAADRLADVDREQAAWKDRIGNYLAQRAKVAGNDAALQQLRDSMFSVNEQKRLPAYEP